LSVSPRQAAVLAAGADGAPLSTVAERLGTTREQVSARLSEAYVRLDVTYLPRVERRAAAVRIARRHQLIPAATQATEAAVWELQAERGCQ
jgi:DNA-binding NarL/FixJ family response regulator